MAGSSRNVAPFLLPVFVVTQLPVLRVGFSCHNCLRWPAWASFLAAASVCVRVHVCDSRGASELSIRATIQLL